MRKAWVQNHQHYTLHVHVPAAQARKDDERRVDETWKCGMASVIHPGWKTNLLCEAKKSTSSQIFYD